ncbi:formin-like protein 16 isoform X1 [Gallus gallus]|uniref:formin-like protein 16 isoform X1 n=1 Tax=Gallus gallus TaxID=9031 RepID=UPI001F00120A|nr:formin-like protein 16 isoform X1 [Gallus gallus]
MAARGAVTEGRGCGGDSGTIAIRSTQWRRGDHPAARRGLRGCGEAADSAGAEPETRWRPARHLRGAVPPRAQPGGAPRLPAVPIGQFETECRSHWRGAPSWPTPPSRDWPTRPSFCRSAFRGGATRAADCRIQPPVTPPLHLPHDAAVLLAARNARHAAGQTAAAAPIRGLPVSARGRRLASAAGGPPPSPPLIGPRPPLSPPPRGGAAGAVCPLPPSPLPRPALAPR